MSPKSFRLQPVNHFSEPYFYLQALLISRKVVTEFLDMKASKAWNQQRNFTTVNSRSFPEETAYL